MQEELSEAELTARMRSLLEPFVLRRLKEHVRASHVFMSPFAIPFSCIDLRIPGAACLVWLLIWSNSYYLSARGEESLCPE